MGDINQKEKKAFKRLLELDTYRGPDSTGVILVKNDNTVVFDKKVGSPWEFFKTTKLGNNQGCFDGWLKAMIGHNRWATRGEVNADNAHPFDFEKVIGVHNGTIEYRAYKYLEDNGMKSAVDSEMLYATINNMGLKDTINNVAGAWSLAYWDKEKKTVNLFRNKDRPMYYTFSKNKKTIFFASEAWMIHIACGSAGIEIDKVVSTQEDKHYFCELEDFKPLADKLSIRYYKEDIKGKTFPVITYTTYGHKTYNWGWEDFEEGDDKDKLNEDQKLIAKLSDDNGLCPIYYDQKSSKVDRFHSSIAVTFRALSGEYDVKVYLTNSQSTDEFLKTIMDGAYWFTIKLDTVITSIKGETWLIGRATTLSTPKDWENLFEAFDFDEAGNLIHKEKEKKEKKKKDEEETWVAIGNSGIRVSPLRFEQLMRDGCCVCGDNTSGVKEADKIVWLDYPTTWLCPDCADKEEAHKHVQPPLPLIN